MGCREIDVFCGHPFKKMLFFLKEAGFLIPDFGRTPLKRCSFAWRNQDFYYTGSRKNSATVEMINFDFLPSQGGSIVLFRSGGFICFRQKGNNVEGGEGAIEKNILVCFVLIGQSPVSKLCSSSQNRVVDQKYSSGIKEFTPGMFLEEIKVIFL